MPQTRPPGWCVLTEDGSVPWLRIWTPNEASLHINTKEALASWLGVNDLRTRQLIKDPNSGRWQPIYFRVIRPSRTLTPCANRVIGLIRRHCNCCLSWSPTEVMPADPFSRGIVPEAMPAFIEAVLVTMGERFGKFYKLPKLNWYWGLDNPVRPVAPCQSLCQSPPFLPLLPTLLESSRRSVRPWSLNTSPPD